MSNKIKFGFRIPASPIDGSSINVFRDQMFRFIGEASEHFDSVWFSDHFIPWHPGLEPTTATLEAWTTIAYLAALFPDIQIGSIVLSQSYRPPALLAKMAATLQTLSAGRFILGIGAGWLENEYLAYGYDFPSAASRIEQLEETVQIVKRLWQEPRVTFEGKYYQVTEAICEPKPEPVPPLMIGAGGRKLSLRVVAKYADWWNIGGGTPENYRDLSQVLQEHCLDVGRNYDQIVKTWANECVAVARDHHTAQALAINFLTYEPGISIVGNPEDVVRQLKVFVNLGVEHFILRFADFPSSQGALLFAQEVIPELS